MSLLFEPSDIKDLTGITPDVLRDWRRRKFLVSVGEETQSGRWVYRIGDVTRLAFVQWLFRSGLVADLRRAFEIADVGGLMVYEHLLPEDRRHFIRQSGDARFLIIPPAGMDLSPMASASQPDLAAIRPTLPGVLILDIEAIARELPSALREIVVANDRREARHGG